MFGTAFFRILRNAFRNFQRNIWLSIATVMIMTLTLLTISTLYFINILGSEVLRTIEQKVDVSVVFKEDVSDDQLKLLTDDISSRVDVDSVRIVSSEEALTLFRQRHADDPFIEESLRELEDNPLPASMYIVATEPRHYQQIARDLDTDKYMQYIEKINFENSRTVIDRLISVMTSVRNAGFVITIVFSCLVILIMFNTIRLAIYSFREEIDIMRLVGASKWYIQGPFLIEAMFVAILSVVLTIVLLYPALNASSSQIEQFFFSGDEAFSIYDYAVSNWMRVVGLQLGISVLLAVVSSYIAIRRYLR